MKIGEYKFGVWLRPLVLWAFLILLGAHFCFAPFHQPGFPIREKGGTVLAQAARVDLNRADREALCLLPGVGEKKAEKILEYRRAHGPFASLQEVENVEGIGPKTVESWQGLAYLGKEEKEAG